MKAIILHGTGASPEYNWFRWLEGSLNDREWETWVPRLPNPKHPSGREWTNFVLGNTPFAIDGETVVVGHSAGAVVSLVLAQTVRTPLKAVFAVAPPRDNEHLKWSQNDRLFDVPFDFDAIQRGAGRLVVLGSDNDIYCPLDQTKDVCQRAGGEMIEIPGQGHFNTEASEQYRRFPKLLEIIDKRVGL